MSTTPYEMAYFFELFSYEPVYIYEVSAWHITERHFYDYRYHNGAAIKNSLPIVIQILDLNFGFNGGFCFVYQLISHVILSKPFSNFVLLLYLILKSPNNKWIMHLISKGSFQGFQKNKFHGNQATLPEVITFFHFCGQNDQFRPRISEMVVWYIKLKPMSPESL